MTPEEIENQFNSLSSSTHDYTQERYTSFYHRGTETRSLMNSLPTAFKYKIYSLFRSLSSGFRFGIGFALALFTAGLFAVTVSGTFNTFSSGTLLKSSDINANFATLKAAIEGIPSQPSMRLIYETDTTISQQQINISGLDGNTDMVYQIKLRMIGNSGPSNLNVLLNGDITSTNYETQDIYAGGTGTPGMSQLTSNLGLTCGGLGNGLVSSCNMELIAKSGSSRLAMAVLNQQVSGTSMAYTRYAGSIWNNSSSNITSITIYSSIANGIGAGSHIEVWARR